jgi:hypothetical protein
VADFPGDGPFAYLGWGMEITELMAGVNAFSLFVYIFSLSLGTSELFL